MRLTICLTAAAMLCAGATAQAKTTFQLKRTTWTFVDKKEGKVKESIDAEGNYLANPVAGKHLDHGTSRMKGSKACFTSKMDKDGEVCWTTRPVSIGHSMVTTNDKGRKLKVTRVAYVPMKM
jgi:hypothetical protein